MGLYMPSAFKILGSGAAQINGVHDLDDDPAISLLEAYAAGAVEPSYLSIGSQQPMQQFSIYELAIGLTLVGLGGLKIPQSTVITGWEQYFAQVDNGGDRVAGSTHAKLAGASGILVVSEITARQNGPASLKLKLQMTYDGTNAPWTPSTSVALPSNIYLSEAFTLGPVNINGTRIADELVDAVTVSTGIQIGTKAGSGEVFPRRAHVVKRQPMLRIDSNRWEDFSTYGLSGTAQGATASKVFFRKMTNDGDRVADATAEHVSVATAASKGIIHCSAKRAGDPNADIAGQILIGCRGGSTNSIVFNSATAIT